MAVAESVTHAKREVALASLPTLTGREKVWRITWRVRSHSATVTRDLKLAIYQKDGELLYAASEEGTKF